MATFTSHVCCVIIAIAAWDNPSAFAQSNQKIRIAALGGGLWTASQPLYCKERGEFAKAGLDVDIVLTRGGSETVQAVITSSVDIGYQVGFNAVLAAQMRDAKIKIVSSGFAGNSDTYYYVRADSPIKSLNDLKGASVAYGRPGSVSEALLRALKSERGIEVKPVSGGNHDAIYTMTMTKQIDVGMAVPPTGMAQLRKGEIRLLFDGNVIESQRDVVNRVSIVGSVFLAENRAAVTKFFRVLQGCIDWMYANMKEGSKIYAAANKIDDELAERALAFYPQSKSNFGPLTGMDEIIKEAVTDKFIERAPTPEQLKSFIDLVYQK